MKLKQPAAPFERLEFHGDSVSLDTEGKVLVLPSGNPDILPSHNEYTLNSNRLTIAESPFGGLKGPGSPDYCVGTVNIIDSDGIYLSDLNGQNSSKTLTAGKLAELGHLSVYTTNHTIVEEFIIRNDGPGTDVRVIDDCSSADGWGTAAGTGITITPTTDGMNVAGASNSSGVLAVYKNVAYDINNATFMIIKIRPTKSGSAYLRIGSYTGGNCKIWSGTRYNAIAGIWNTFVLPFRAPVGTTGSLPNQVLGSLDLANIVQFAFGVLGQGSTVATSFDIAPIIICNGTWAKVEVAVPDNLSATSLSLYTHNGTAYQLCSSHSLDSAYALVAQTSANCTLLDSTKLDDVYGTGNGRSVFPKGESGETKTGSSGTITYSQNKGTSRRIGLKVSLPPSDGGRTNFNKCRIKTVISYAADSAGKYSATYQFSDTTSASTGLQNLSKPWIALYDPAKTEIDFYLFTYRPKNLEFKRDESGTIHELKLFPGNGQLYHGRVTHCNPALDSDSNNIPDCLEASIEGSITKFLQSYGMVE